MKDPNIYVYIIPNLIYIILPGFIGSRLYYYLVGKKGESGYEGFGRTILYAFISYTLTYWILKAIGHVDENYSIYNFIFIHHEKFDFIFEVVNIILSVLIAIALSYVNTKHLVHRSLRRVTNSIGEDTILYINFCNSSKKKRIRIVDKIQKITYEGLVDDYNEIGQDVEFILKDAKITYSDSKKSESHNKVYICKKRDLAHIVFL